MLLIEKDGKNYIDDSIVTLIENGNNDELVSMLKNESIKDIVDSFGTTLLHLSTLYDNHFMTEFLFRSGIDVNAKNKIGDSPLIIAADRMHFDQVELLLNANADIKTKNLKSESALTSSVDQWHSGGPAKDILELIFEKLKLHHPSTEEMVEALICAGCHFSDVLYLKHPYSMQFMKTMLQKKYYHINSQNNRNGDTILHSAVALNNIDLIKELLVLGSDITLENKNKQIPVAWYISYNSNQDKQIVKMLMPKVYDWLGPLGVERLKIRIVLTRGTKETLKIFQECSNVDMKVKDRFGETPLHHLMYNNNKGILEVFEDTEFDINARDYRFKRSAIHHAAEKGDLESIKFLLARNAELDYFDSFIRTPLMLSVSNDGDRHSKKECVQLLLLHGADAQITNIRHLSAISVATAHGTYDQVDPVLAHLALVEVTGKIIIPLVLDQIISDDQMKICYDLYKQQLENMKTDYIWRSVSVFDCLTAAQEKIAFYAQWHQFTDRFVNQKFNFNSYFVAILQTRFAKAIEIRDMRRKVVPILEEIFNMFNLGCFLTNKIVDYLDLNDLQKFF